MTGSRLDTTPGIRRTRLDSGLRVVTERLPGLRSVAVGFWVGSGARDEAPEEAGVSHFLEHLLFKGADGQTAADISAAVERVGGDMNAVTGHEATAFFVRVPDQHVPLALEILAGIVWRPRLAPEDIESERQVILEEIRMRDDTPDELVHDVFAATLFPGHALGRGVAGTKTTVAGLTRDMLARYHHEHYRPSNVVVAAAGNVDHEEMVRLVAAAEPTAAGTRRVRSLMALDPAGDEAVLERPLEQAHMVMGARALPRDDPDRFALAVLDLVLGGGMSSRLFQEIRERRGLAYSVYSFRSAYQDTGSLGIYCGTAPERVPDVLGVVNGELDRLLAEGGIAPNEMERAKGHLAGSLAISLESSSSRMHRIGRAELMTGELPSIDAVVADVEAVSPDAVGRVIERVFGSGGRSLALVGPIAHPVSSKPVPIPA
jgi:predicted Zn-dependent peptidase